MFKSKILNLLLLFLIIIVVMSFSMFGCKTTTSTETTSAATETTAGAETTTAGETTAAVETTGKIKLDFPHWFFSHGGTFDVWIKGAVDEFQKQNPNIEVNGYAVGYDEFWDKIDTAIAAGTPPDIIAAHNTNLGKYISAGALLPLDDLINMNDIKDNWSSLQKEGVTSVSPDGKTYLLTSDMGFYLPMYRPSVFKKAGVNSYAKTPEEFIEMAKKLTQSGIKGYAAMINPGNWQEGLYDLAIWTIGLGGHYGKDGKPDLNSPEVIKAITYLKQLFDAGVMPKEIDKGTYRKMFATGEVGTLIDGPWMYEMAVGWDPSVKGDFEVVDLPFPTQRVTSFFEGLSVSSKSKNPKEAAKLIEFLCSPDQQKKLVEITGIMSAREDIYKDQTWSNGLAEKWPWFQKYIDHVSQAVLNNPAGMPGEKIPEVVKIWYTAYEKVLYENADPTKAMNDAQTEAMALFK